MPIKFIKISNTDDCVVAISKQLKSALKSNNGTLWLIPGGSNIPITVQIMDKITSVESSKLTIMLSDERYGPIDNPDSNFRQYKDAGFKPKNAKVIEVLKPNHSLAVTVKNYNQAVEKSVRANNHLIAFLGMGPDGHVAGILPNSPATKSSYAWVVGYKTAEFTRITLTPFALSHVNKVFVLARGEAKRQTLSTLKSENLPIADQPAQLLKKFSSAVIFNDQIGEKL